MWPWCSPKVHCLIHKLSSFSQHQTPTMPTIILLLTLTFTNKGRHQCHNLTHYVNITILADAITYNFPPTTNPCSIQVTKYRPIYLFCTTNHSSSPLVQKYGYVLPQDFNYAPVQPVFVLSQAPPPCNAPLLISRLCLITGAQLLDIYPPPEYPILPRLPITSKRPTLPPDRNRHNMPTPRHLPHMTP